jgi:hypothetical protein
LRAQFGEQGEIVNLVVAQAVCGFKKQAGIQAIPARWGN